MNEGQKNYNVCFTVFSTLMGLALLVATQLPFKYSTNTPSKDPASIPLNNINQGPQVNRDPDRKSVTRFRAKITQLLKMSYNIQMMIYQYVVCNTGKFRD